VTRRRGEGLERVEREIVREKAATLGRAGERLEAALQAVHALGRALDDAPDAGRRAALLAEYEAARRRAAHARTILVIQREAIGLRQHRDVDRKFPEPPRRT
jgi:2-polyprenyl-6-methoxyphenol hydroxylase-like FAD-dependent oxidoreductase